MRILNRGGFANADVLLAFKDRGAVVVKDYSRRSAIVRHLLAPLLLRHELAMLECLEGLPGLPRPLGRVGRSAFAMEYLEGWPLRRRSHARALPRAFFDALDGVLDGLASRGVVHLDLRSPSNVLCTASLAPALVDLMSAWRPPFGMRALRWLEARALLKLRARFEASGVAPSSALQERVATVRETDVVVGAFRRRVCYAEEGPLDDPVPALLLPDAGLTSAQFRRIQETGARVGRRSLAVDPPGFGASRAVPFVGPGAVAMGNDGGLSALARALVDFLDALRLPLVDLVGIRWGGLLARALAVRAPHRCRALVTLDTPGERLPESFRERLQAARLGRQALAERLLSDLPEGADPQDRGRLEWNLARRAGAAAVAAYRRTALGSVPYPACPWLFITADSGAPEGLEIYAPAVRIETWSEPWDPEQVWRALGALVSAGPVKR